MAKHLFKSDSGNLVAKVAETPEHEAALRAQGFKPGEEMWPGSPTVEDAATVAEVKTPAPKKGKA